VVRDAAGDADPDRAYPTWALRTAEPPPAPPDFAPGAPRRPVGRRALAAAAVLAVALVAVVVSRRVGTGPDGPVSPDVVGACIRYGAVSEGDGRRVEAVVGCADPHDGRVLALAPDRTRCPGGTDAVLVTPVDREAAGTVLCVDEDQS
jgi:hypothetical protein